MLMLMLFLMQQIYVQIILDKFLYKLVDKYSIQMKKNDPQIQKAILSNFWFNESLRKFQLLDPALGVNLVNLKIGTKLLTESNTYIWSCQPEQFIYLISTHNFSSETIMRAYANMNSFQITKTIFYLWMRKRGKFLKLSTPSIYRIYPNIEAYNLNKQAYRIKIFESDFALQTINWLELKKQCDKIASIRNRDLIIVDIL